MENTLTELTARQKEILKFIHTEIKTNQLPPTLRDIAANFNFSSPSSVQDHLAPSVFFLLLF